MFQFKIKNIISYVFILSSCVLLSSCSSQKSQFKAFLKCGIAAAQLEQYEAEKQIGIKLEKWVRETQYDLSPREMSFLAQEVRNEMGIYGINSFEQFEIYVKTFNSSKCRKIHGQKKFELSNLMNDIFSN